MNECSNPKCKHGPDDSCANPLHRPDASQAAQQHGDECHWCGYRLRYHTPPDYSGQRYCDNGLVYRPKKVSAPVAPESSEQAGERDDAELVERAARIISVAWEFAEESLREEYRNKARRVLALREPAGYGAAQQRDHGEHACEECGGMGVKVYGSTALWRRGAIGGAAMTPGLCDVCWGSGSKDWKGPDMRRIEADMDQLRRSTPTLSAGVLWKDVEAVLITVRKWVSSSGRNAAEIYSGIAAVDRVGRALKEMWEAPALKAGGQQ